MTYQDFCELLAMAGIDFDELEGMSLEEIITYATERLQGEN